MGRVLECCALGHGKLDVALNPATNPDAPIPISIYDGIKAYILPSFFSLAALLIKINQFLLSMIVRIDEVDEDGIRSNNLAIPDTYDAKVTAVLHFFYC